MSRDRDLKALEKRLRQSRRAVPVYAGMLVGVVFVFGLLGWLNVMPVWLTIVFAIAVGMTTFTLIGDLVNCRVCTRQLKALQVDARTKASR